MWAETDWGTMLPSQYRMRQSAEFGATMRRGRRAGRPALTVAFLPPGERAEEGAAPPPRVGLTVGKTVGNAVVRHRTQRRLRHLLRPRLGVLPPGSLLVVRAKPVASTLGHDVLAAQLDEALTAVLRPAKAVRHRRQVASTKADRAAAAGGDVADP